MNDLTTRQKTIVVIIGIVAMAVWLLVAQTEKASAIELEDGVTFLDGGICIEADGTQGLSSPDGQCVTPGDYDVMFSYERLSTVPTFSPFDGDTTVAERYNIEPESKASIRPRSFMGVDLASFAGAVKIAHGLYLL